MKSALGSRIRTGIQTLVVLAVLSAPLQIIGQDVPEPLYPLRLVNDYIGFLKEPQYQRLEQKLRDFNDSTSTQIVIVLVRSLNGMPKEEFADRIGERWGVGQHGKDNGIVVLVKPKIRDERGEARISIAYGLEGVIPDAVANRIVNHEMIPHFREGDYFTGLDKGTNTLMALAAGEFTADEYKKKTEGSVLGIIIPVLLILLVIYLMSRNSNRHYTTGSHGTSLWTTLWLASMMSSRGHSGSWGNFRSGSGSFGSGGGGFGGFGGGSFGGGGAGGSW